MKGVAMKRCVVGVALTTLAIVAQHDWAFAALPDDALSEVVGLWMSFDDNTHEPSAQIRVFLDSKGALVGRIEKVLDPKASEGELCTQCPGERKNLPLVGLEIMHGGQRTTGEWLWSQGKILDPEDGDEYTYQLKLLEGAQVLLLRGYWGPFWRSQKWSRVR